MLHDHSENCTPHINFEKHPTKISVLCESSKNETTVRTPVLMKVLQKIKKNTNIPENSRPHKTFEMKNY